MIGLQVFDDATKGAILADFTSTALNVTTETDEHGFAYLSFFVPMTTDEAFRYYNLFAVAHVELRAYGFPVFLGRIEDKRIVPGGLEIGAFGYSNAMRDVPYTALWSSKSYDAWTTGTDDDNSTFQPEKYHIDNNNRLYITLRQGETYGNNTDQGALFIELPDLSNTDPAVLSFTAALNLPASWTRRILSFDSGWTGGSTDSTDFSAGSNSITIAANQDIVALVVYNLTGSDYTNTGDTDDFFVKLTDVRIKGTSSANVYADEIVDDLISFTNGINSGQISSSTVLVNSPTVDLDEAVYEDRYPADILDELAAIGDNSTPPEQYEWGAWEGQQLHFRQRGSVGRDWYTDLAQLEINSTLDTLFNSAYGVYRDERGMVSRTAVNGDTPSQTKYSIVRRSAVQAQTTSATTAAIYRDAVIEARKDITPRAVIATTGLFTASGASVPLWMCRAGDTITIRNLPPTAGTTLDKIRKFRVSRTRYDVDNDILEPTPELDPPTVEFLVASALRK